MKDSLRENQIKAVDELIKSADYVQNSHLLNREQIVFLCNREIEKRIDSLYFKPIEDINQFQWNHVLDRIKELLE